jgi:hypothetical protein
MTGFLIFVRASSAAASGGTRTFASLGGTNHEYKGLIEFLDSSSKNMYSTDGWLPAELRHIMLTRHFSSQIGASLAGYFLPVAETPEAAIHKGQVDGYVNYDGSQQIRITPGSGFTSATYDIYVVAYRLNHLEIETLQTGGSKITVQTK